MTGCKTLKTSERSQNGRSHSPKETPKSKRKATRQPRCLDLFAGAGGLSCGLEMAGFAPILASDINPVYVQTYKVNHPGTIVIDEDIRNISSSELLSLTKLKEGELDLLAGGPPCQGFSVNAPVRSLDDQRNHLFKDFMRIAEAFAPKAILIENVPGMISLGMGTVIKAIVAELERMGYTVNYRILFAAHYGVPQTRYRTIFVALKNGEKFEFPEPTYNATGIANFTGAKELCLNILPLFAPKLKKHTTLWDAISDLPEIQAGVMNDELDYAAPPQSEYQKLLRTGSKKVYNHSCARLASVNMERQKHIPLGGNWTDIPFDILPFGMKRAGKSDHTKRYGRTHPNGLSCTILTKCDPHWGSYFHPHQERVFSVREAARIQSFPDTFVFTGSLTQQYEQVGNAVPPLLAKTLGKAILDIIK